MRLTDLGDHVELENEAGEKIRLSQEELAKLALSARQIFHQQASRSREGFYPLPTASVLGARVSLDAHHENAVLVLAGEDGSQDGYVFPLETATAILAQLTQAIAEIEKANRAKTVQ